MPKAKKLHPGQVSKEAIARLTEWAQDNDQDPFRLMLHPAALEKAGLAHKALPAAQPEFMLLVDTAEPDYHDIVERLRMMSYFAVARSLQRPVDGVEADNEFCGDFAVLQWLGQEDEDDDIDYCVPAGYRVLVDIERKTMPDLVASYTDGRKERQRYDHLQSSALRHVMLFEGSTTELDGRMASWARALSSDYDHLVYASGFNVRMILSHAELFDTLANAVRYSAQAVLDERMGIKQYLMPAFSGKDSSGRRVMDDPRTAFVGMLTRAKGVSAAAASAIIDTEFPTMMDFCRALVAADDDAAKRAALVQRLSDVKVPTTNSSSSRSATRFASRAERMVALFAPPKKKRVIDDDDSDSSPSKGRGNRRKVAHTDSSDDEDGMSPLASSWISRKKKKVPAD